MDEPEDDCVDPCCGETYSQAPPFAVVAETVASNGIPVLEITSVWAAGGAVPGLL